MKILLCGGGTGGHITPILAIAHEIKKLSPDCDVGYVGEKKGKFKALTDNNALIDHNFEVHAGKFRRYHKQSWLERIFKVRTNLLNIRDMFYVVFGIFESILLLKRYQPDVIFLKGGYVGLPVGIAARFLKIPYLTHDSDAMASLTNSLIGKSAIYNLTGSRVEYYKYDKTKTIQVGVPVSSNYSYVNDIEKDKFKRDLGIPITAKLILIIGGSLGSREVNKAFRSIIDELLIEHKNVYVIHQVGKGNLEIYEDKDFTDRLQISEFYNDMYMYSGASDIVITRAGANTLAELSIQGKTLIIIPNHMLTGGHQLKNAHELRDLKAAIVITESEIKKDPKILYRNITRLLNDNKLSSELSHNIRKNAFQDSSKKIAEILVKIK